MPSRVTIAARTKKKGTRLASPCLMPGAVSILRHIVDLPRSPARALGRAAVDPDARGACVQGGAADPKAGQERREALVVARLVGDTGADRLVLRVVLGRLGAA